LFLFSGESSRRLGSIALRDRDIPRNPVNIGNCTVSSNLTRSAMPFLKLILPPQPTLAGRMCFGFFDLKPLDHGKQSASKNMLSQLVFL
jgi:hypothetical protein